MSDSSADSPVQSIPAFASDDFGFAEIEMPPAVGWVVHLVAGKPQQTSGHEMWAWCKVTADEPGYTDIVFTETDGQTITDPYPKPTLDSPDRPVRLGPVVFKVFC